MFSTKLTTVTLFALGVLSTGAQAQTFTSQLVNAANNIYGAGHASPPGGGNLPTGYTLNAGTGRILTFSSVTGSITYNNSNFNDPDGIGSVSDLAVNASTGISGIQNLNHAGFLTGVFLSAAEPADPAPTTLVFSDTGSGGSTATSFTTLTPVLNQTFFIGDGLTGDGTGSIQQFIVPNGATRLYLGFADAGGYHGDPGAYGDNFGNFTASFTISGPASTPEPSTYALLAASAFTGIAFARRYKARKG